MVPPANQQQIFELGFAPIGPVDDVVPVDEARLG